MPALDNIDNYTPPWGNAPLPNQPNGWADACYFATIQAADIDKDGRAELIGRGAGGIETYSFTNLTARWQQTSSNACNFTDQVDWNNPDNYLTIHLGDIDDDGCAELIGRGTLGIDTWKFVDGAWQRLATQQCRFTDANGWSAGCYYETIQLGDIDGDGCAELIGRGALGIDTWKWQGGSTGWANLQTQGTDFTDDNGWTDPCYFQTIHLADIDGDGCAELIGRGALGIDTYRFTNNSWTNIQSGTTDFRDGPNHTGWALPQYYQTIQFADIDGDRHAELIARDVDGIKTWRFADGAWSQLAEGDCGFTDANGWWQQQYYQTIHLGDIDGDGYAELIGRGEFGIDAWKWISGAWTALAVQTDVLSDVQGADALDVFPTIQLADVNGDRQAELIARTADGVVVWQFDTVANAWFPPVVFLSVDARMMENYVLASAITNASSAVPVANAAGEIEVFTIVDGLVYEVHPDPASDTGFSQVPVPLPAGATTQKIAVGLTDQNLLAVFAVTGDYDNLITAVVQQPAGSSVRWGAALAPLPANGPIAALDAVRGDHLYLGLAAGTTVAGQSTTAYCTYLTTWDSANPTLHSPSAPTAGINSTQPVTIAITPDFSTVEVFAGGSPYLQVPSGPAPDADPYVLDAAIVGGTTYLVLSDGVLYTLAGGAVTQVAPAPLLKSLSAAGDALFGLTQDGLVAWIDPGGPDVVEDLGIPALGLAAAVDGDGDPIALAVGTAGITVVSTSPETGPNAGEWQTTPIALESSGQITPVQTFTAELAFISPDGLPDMGGAVTIATSELIELTVNGVTEFVDPQRPFAATADQLGKISLRMPTSSLSAPQLQITASQSVYQAIIEPNASVRQRLSGLTAAQLTNPTDFYGDPIDALLTGSYVSDASSIANVVTASMSLVPPTQAATLSSTIDLAHVPEQHWRFDLGSGRAVFTALTAQQARSLLDADSENVAGGSAFGIDWGAAWEAVRNGVGHAIKQATQLLDVTVSVIGGAINATIHWVIDGAKYVFKGLITKVQQAFDIVEGVFETIGAAFDRLFNWLGFLFNWNDIVLTTKAIKFLIGQSHQVMSAALSTVKAIVDGAIGDWSNIVDSNIDAWVNDVMGKESPLTLTAGTPTVPGTSFATGNNVVMSAFAANVGAATEGTLKSLTASIGDEVATSLQAQLQECAQDFQSDASFADAATYFQTMAQTLFDSPSEAIRAGLAGLLKVAAGMIEFALEEVQKVFDALVDALQSAVDAAFELLAAEWYIPVVSELYKWATKSSTDPTPGDVVALTIALPTTVLYKITFNSAPFADKEAEEAFEDEIAAQLAPSRLPGSLSDVAIPDSPPRLSSVVLEFVFATYAVGSFVNVATTCVIDAFKPNLLPPTDPSNVDRFFSIVAFGGELTTWIASCPLLTNGSTPATGWIVWLVGAGVLGVVFDGAVLWFSKVAPPLEGDFGVILSVLFSLVNMALAVMWLFEEHPCDSLTFIATFMPGLAGLFRWLRSTPVEQVNINGVPLAPLNRIVLVDLDLVLRGGAAGITAWQQLQAVNEAS